MKKYYIRLFFLRIKRWQNDTKPPIESVKLYIRSYHFDTNYIIWRFLEKLVTFFVKTTI